MRASVWLAARIAWRYLCSKKKYGAVSAITWISIIGVAVATAATVCVLSVFNGFQDVLGMRMEQLAPDVEILSQQARTFEITDSLLDAIKRVPGVKAVCSIVEDRALAIYAGQEMPVRVKGIDTEIYRANSCLDSIMVAGSDTFQPRNASDNQSADDTNGEFSEEAILASELGSEQECSVVASAGVAMRLGINVDSENKLMLISPQRQGMVNMANPAASLQMEEATVEGVYQAMQSDLDKDYVLMQIDDARRLLDIETPRVSSLYIYAMQDCDPARLAASIARILPETLVAHDILQQHESQFRMSNIEKWITFLLLSFILLIASFNLVSSMSMLVIDKQENLSILQAYGATREMAGQIFAWESGIVTVLGGAIGIVLGAALSMLQQHFGLIRLNGDPSTLIVQSYPAALHWSDLVVVAIPLVIVGTLTALITARFAKSRL